MQCRRLGYRPAPSRHCNRRDGGVRLNGDVKPSRDDGCELERSTASADERNRPQRRPRDDKRMATIGASKVGIVSGVGAMDVSRSEAQRAQTNVIARCDDRATTNGWRRLGASKVGFVSGVGARDVSWSEAQRAQTNVIARNDDRATTNEYRRQLLRREA
jgi:hypothetical protein